MLFARGKQNRVGLVDICVVAARCQPRGAQGQEPASPSVADTQAYHQQPGRVDKPDRSRLDKLYGAFYRSELYGLLQLVNTYLVRWAGKKFKRLRVYKRCKVWWKGWLNDSRIYSLTGRGCVRSPGLDKNS